MERLGGERVLVTGGAGFIGSHLVDALLERGCEVRVLDDLSTGSVENLASARASARFGFALGSVLEPDAVEPLVRSCDRVFHLAAAVGVRRITDAPVDTIEINVRGTSNVLAIAARHGKPVLLTSTSEVYGRSSRLPFSEDDEIVLGPSNRSRWSYACSKALGEFEALAHHRSSGLPVVVARLFNTVGPRQIGRYGMVVPRFVRRALAGEPLTVFGDGEQTRCFCWVGDTVRALVDLAAEPLAVGGIFNVGSSEEVTINELARRVIAHAGSGSSIERVPYDEAFEPGFEDMRRRAPDTSRLRALTGWMPSLELDEILLRTLAGFGERAAAASASPFAEALSR